METYFQKLEKQAVMGHFKSLGTRDPDIVHVKKNQLIFQFQILKYFGIVRLVLGVFLAAVIVGIPVIIIGIYLGRKGVKGTKMVEAACAEFLATPAP